jgi:WD40 repeat protein
MIKRLLLTLSLILTIAGSIAAQETVTTLPDNLQPITPDNADQLQEIARIGSGVFNRGIAYSPDGGTLAVGGSLGIWLYDANDLNALPTLIDLDAPVYDIEFSHDGRYLVYGVGNGGGVHVMDFASREEVLRVQGSQFALHPDGNLLAVGRVTFDNDENCETCGYFPHCYGVSKTKRFCAP